MRHIEDPEKSEGPEATICVGVSPLEDEWESSLPDMKTVARARMGYLTNGQFFIALGADEQMCSGCLSISLHMLADSITDAEADEGEEAS